MAEVHTGRALPSGRSPGPGAVWPWAACAAAVGWSCLVAASPRQFFLWAVPAALVWMLLSAAARPRRPGPTGAPRRPRPRLPDASDLALGLTVAGALYAVTRLFLWTFCGPLSRALCEPLHGMFARFEPQALGPGLALLVVIAPAEELFWRGVVQPRLVARAGPWAGVAAATALAAALALASGEPFLALATLPTYAAWGALAAWRGRLWPAVISHAAWSVLVATLAPPL